MLPWASFSFFLFFFFKAEAGRLHCRPMYGMNNRTTKSASVAFLRRLYSALRLVGMPPVPFAPLSLCCLPLYYQHPSTEVSQVVKLELTLFADVTGDWVQRIEPRALNPDPSSCMRAESCGTQF